METKCKILLLQARESLGEAGREAESIIRASGLSVVDLRRLDLYRGEVVPEALVGASALIIGGSKLSTFENDVPYRDALFATVVRAVEMGLPTLGICFGAQLLAHALGGGVVRDFEHRERGTYDIMLTPEGTADPLFVGVPIGFASQCSHQDRIVRLPSGATLLASSDLCSVHAFRIGTAPIYGVQFHPERSRDDFAEALVAQFGSLDAASERFLTAPLRESPEAYSLVRRFVVLAGSLELEA